MRKKKLIALLLSITTMLFMVGCGTSSNSSTETKEEVVKSGEESTESVDTENTEEEKFNYDDEHIKKVQAYLENQKYFGYSGEVKENDSVMIVAEEYYDFDKYIVEDKSDYSGYREALVKQGYSDEEIGTNQVNFHSLIDCKNEIYIVEEKDGWKLYEGEQSNVDFKTGASYKSGWEVWVSTMISSGLYFNDGDWSEDEDKVIYTKNFNDDDTEEVVTLNFEVQSDGSYKPLDFISNVTSYTDVDGYAVGDDGEVSTETSTTRTAIKNVTNMVYDYDDHKLEIPKYSTVEVTKSEGSETTTESDEKSNTGK